MKKLPKSDSALLLRTDFRDDDALCEAVQEPSDEGFQARFDYISDLAYEGLTVKQLVVLASREEHSFSCIADRTTLTNSERPILVVDLYDQPGRTFRVIPSEIWSVENNLSIAANMDYSEFADNCDSDGVFRGFS